MTTRHPPGDTREIAPEIKPDRLPDMELVGYLKRWCLIPRSTAGNCYLHHILAGDEPVMHDHPWDFESEILIGGYIEITAGGPVSRKAGDCFRKSATDMHYIESVLPNTWTMVTTGAKCRDWGFLREAGWVSHTTYGGRRMGVIFRNGYEASAHDG